MSLALSFGFVSLPGCGGTPPPSDLTGGTGATGGGSHTTGGSSGSAGSALSAGQAGTSTNMGTGGTGATGGSGATGGTGGSSGSNVGGRNGSGGSAAANGGAASGAGGAPHVGGAPASGGMPATGGRTAQGGRATGGGSAQGGRAAGGASGQGGSGGAAGSVAAGGSPGHTFPPKFAGNIDTRGSIRTDFVQYWDQFSPENAGKWGSVQPNSQDQFNWTSLDAMYKYANDNHIIFKQHNFLWGSQQPGWTANLTSSTGPAAVQNWMNEFCKRYPNTRIIDVVNEPPPHTTPKYINAIGGTGSSGWDWIANAFKWAHAACPNAILVLNDYNNIEYSSDLQHSIDIVTAIKKVNAPIDAIGCQTHGAASLSSATLKANIDKLASGTGLPVYITEYDLNISDDTKQASVMKDQFTMFWQDDNVKGITLWGYIVGATWETNSGLMQSSGTMRPSMSWLMQFLGR